MSNRFFKNFHLPHIPVVLRILLYVLMVVFSGLTIRCLTTDDFSLRQEVIIYIVTFLSLVVGVIYLVFDLKEIYRRVRIFVYENPHTRPLVEDERLRTFAFVIPGVIGNVIFAILNAVTGIKAESTWFGSMAAYYILLAVMRLSILNQERVLRRLFDEETHRKKEWTEYKRDSILLVLLSIPVGAMSILLHASIGGRSYPGFAIYAVAFYTFLRIFISISGLIRSRRMNSPLIAILQKVGYVDACVAMLLLQTAMFASFSTEGDQDFVLQMNLITGSIVSAMILLFGVHGLFVVSSKSKS